jgi:hypothetical protein
MKSNYTDLIEWLKCKTDYELGVNLYQKYGTSANFKRLLKVKGKTKQTMADLIYELDKIAKLNKVEVTIVKKIKKSIAQVKPVLVKINPVINVKPISKPNYSDSKNEQVRQLIDAKNRLFKIYVSKFHTLEFLPEVERKKVAFEILDLWEQISEYWLQIDSLEQFGVLPVKINEPEKTPITQLDKAELMQKMINLRTYISKYKRLNQNAKTEQTRIKNEIKMNKFQIELNEVEQKLKLK